MRENTRHKKSRIGVCPIFTVLFSLILLLPVPVRINAQQEDSAGESGRRVTAGQAAGLNSADLRAMYADADRLIKNGFLDRALLLLVEIGKTDPEQIKRIQKRIRKVREVKNSINNLFEELKNASIEGDADRIKQSIGEIKNKDAEPNRNLQDKLILASVLVGRIVNDLIADDFFKRANEHLAAGDYKGAIEIYRDGFFSDNYLELYDQYVELAQSGGKISIYADDPDREETIRVAYNTYGPAGDGAIEDLDINLDNWTRLVEDVFAENREVSEFIDNSESDQWSGRVGEFFQSLDRIDSLFSTVNDSVGDIFVVRDDLYNALNGIPEEFRLDRIIQFMTGRSGNEGQEGILLAMQLYWDQLFSGVLAAMTDAAREAIESGRTDYKSDAWDSALTSFSRVVPILEAKAAANQFYTDREAASGASEEQAGISAGEMANNNSVRGMITYDSYARAALPLWVRLVEIRRNAPNPDSIDTSDMDTEEIKGILEPIQEAIINVESLQSEWETQINQLSSLPESGAPLPMEVVNALRDDLVGAVDEFRELRVSLYTKALVPLYEILEVEFNSLTQADLNELRSYAVGGNSGSANEVIERHPSKALSEIIEPTLVSLAVLRQDVAQFSEIFVAVLDNENNNNDENYQNLLSYQQKTQDIQTSADDYTAVLQSIADDARDYVSNAKQIFDQIQAIFDDVNIILADGESSINSESVNELYQTNSLYDSADQTMDQVDDLYIQLLQNDLDIGVSSGFDARRTLLRDQIQNAHNRIAIIIKDDALETARSTYNSGDYNSGIVAIQQAQSFWKQVYGDDDFELVAWLNRLRNVQQALQQKDIDPIDPLYTEVNQYMNQASRYYISGVRLVNNQNRTEALPLFEKSKRLTSQVLRLFPGNEAALLLEQRILQQVNPESWQVQVDKLIQDTRQALAGNDLNALRGNEIKKGYYAQLVVLKGIAPDYPGIDDLVYNVEVALGVIIPSLDPQVVAESRRLTNQAIQVWNNLGAVAADRAVILLDQALNLWLENTEASNLKKEILISLEPESLPPLPDELQKIIVFFDLYFSEGNYILANALIDRIASEYPDYTDDPRVTKRLESLEGRL